MKKILTYDKRPIAIVELCPNNPLGESLDEVEGQLCMWMSPNEGLADIVQVSDETAQAIMQGKITKITNKLIIKE